MAYNEKLAERLRAALADLPNVKEKKMFGGLAFMVDDKMCVTAGADRIMCRIDPDLNNEVTKKDGCHTVIMRGHEYKGYVHVAEENIKSKKALDYWIGLALSFNKEAKSSKKK